MMHCGRYRYVKVINGDGVSVTTMVATKQLRSMSITPRLKRLFLSEETVKQMRWNMEGKHDSKDSHFDPKFARGPRSVHLGLSMDGFQPHNIDISPYSCWLIFVMH
jgi:hypothetical protein